MDSSQMQGLVDTHMRAENQGMLYAGILPRTR